MIQPLQPLNNSLDFVCNLVLNLFSAGAGIHCRNNSRLDRKLRVFQTSHGEIGIYPAQDYQHNAENYNVSVIYCIF